MIVGVRGDKPSELPPGLFVGVRIITDTRADAVLIPKRAVVYEGGERYVFTITKDRAIKRKLIAGFEDPQNIEAVSGIAPGETIIVLGHSGLKDGAMVRAVNALAPIPVSPPADAPEAKATVLCHTGAGQSGEVVNTVTARDTAVRWVGVVRRCPSQTVGRWPMLRVIGGRCDSSDAVAP